jgi:hypothetical protein
MQVTVEPIGADYVLWLARQLSEHKLTRDPAVPLISRIRIEKKRQPQPVAEKYIKPNYDGQIFVHFVTGQEVTVVSRNIYDKLIIKWPDGNMTPLGDKDFEVAFSRKL